MKVITGRLNFSAGVKSQVFRSIGYSECLSVLKGTREEKDLMSDISIATRQFAKRQMTYFRNEPAKRGWVVVPKQELPQEKAKKCSERVFHHVR